MPDFRNFFINQTGSLTFQGITLPLYAINCDVVDSNHGGLISGFSGNKRLGFLQLFASLSSGDRDEFFRNSVAWMINRRMGY